MIEYRTGSLLAEKANALINAVNCIGTMGAALALQFKKAWPENFPAYAATCRGGEVRPGRMFVFETLQLTPPRYIINFPPSATGGAAHNWKTSTRGSAHSLRRFVVSVSTR